MFARQIGGSLRNFKDKGKTVFNFSCPLCGDSKKNPLKARGYLFEKRNVLMYTCHNCQTHISFKNFLKRFDSNLFKDYCSEKFKDKIVPVRKKSEVDKTVASFTMEAPVFYSSPLGQLKMIDQLPINHPAVEYIKGRRIPEKYHELFYFVDNFQAWTNTLIPNKFAENTMKYDGPRIIIPFFNKDKKLIGYQGRVIGRSDGLRYITIKFDDEEELVYGMERVDLNKTVYIVEGPIDSLFIDNCIAGACASLPKIENSILIWDNERKNVDICKQMEKAIDAGENIFIWPDGLSVKDINDLYLNIPTRDYWDSFIASLLEKNTYSGLMAKTKFSQWRK